MKVSSRFFSFLGFFILLALFLLFGYLTFEQPRFYTALLSVLSFLGAAGTYILRLLPMQVRYRLGQFLDPYFLWIGKSSPLYKAFHGVVACYILMLVPFVAAVIWAILWLFTACGGC